MQYTPDTEIYSLTYAMNISPVQYTPDYEIYKLTYSVNITLDMATRLSMAELCQTDYYFSSVSLTLWEFVEYLEELNKFTVDRLSMSAVDLKPFLTRYRCEA